MFILSDNLNNLKENDLAGQKLRVFFREGLRQSRMLSTGLMFKALALERSGFILVTQHCVGFEGREYWSAGAAITEYHRLSG